MTIKAILLIINIMDFNAALRNYKNLTEKLIAIRSALDKLEDFFQKGEITEKQYKILRKDYEKELNAIQSEIDALKNKVREDLERMRREREQKIAEYDRYKALIMTGEIDGHSGKSKLQGILKDIANLNYRIKQRELFLNVQNPKQIDEIKTLRPPEIPPLPEVTPIDKLFKMEDDLKKKRLSGVPGDYVKAFEELDKKISDTKAFLEGFLNRMLEEKNKLEEEAGKLVIKLRVGGENEQQARKDLMEIIKRVKDYDTLTQKISKALKALDERMEARIRYKAKEVERVQVETHREPEPEPKPKPKPTPEPVKKTEEEEFEEETLELSPEEFEEAKEILKEIVEEKAQEELAETNEEAAPIVEEPPPEAVEELPKISMKGPPKPVRRVTRKPSRKRVPVVAIILGIIVAGGLGFLGYRFFPKKTAKILPVVEQRYTFMGNPQHNYGTVAFITEDMPKPAWTLDLGGILSQPLIVGSSIYLGNEKGALFCVDTSGRILWSKTLAGGVLSAPVNYGEDVVAGTENGLLYFIHNTGDIRTRMDIGGSILSTPAVIKNRAYVTLFQKGIRAINMEDKSTVWSYAPGDIFKSTPAVDGKMVFVGDFARRFYAFSVKNGKILWSFVSEGAIEAPPVVIDESIVCADNSGYVYRIRKEDGKILWKTSTGNPIPGSPAVKDSLVVVANSMGDVMGISLVDGKIKWTFSTGSIILSTPVIVDKFALVTTGSGEFGEIYAFDIETGKAVWVIPVPTPLDVSPVVVDKYLIVAGRNGQLFAYTTY